MSHIDEGQLHALLDDALDPGEAAALRQHIDACPQCAARLEEEQTLRLRSIAILDAARPAASNAPPFEAVLQRARVEPPARQFQMPGPTRLAWAATIVLALGIGWFGRDFAPRADLQSSKLEPADNAARSTVSPMMSEPVASPVVPPPASAPVANARDANALKDNPAPVGSAAQARGTVSGAVGEQQSGQRVQSAEVRAAERSADALQLKTQSVAAVRDSQQQQGQQQAPPLQQPQQLRRDSGVAAQAAANQVSALAGRGGRGGGGGRGAVAAAAPPATPQPTPVAGAAMAKTAAESWEYLDLAQAEQRVGRTILVVPGLQVDSVAVLNTVAGYRVRLTHRLPSGDALELMQEPVTAPMRDAARSRQEAVVPQPSARPAPSAITAVTINRPDVILTGRARITPDSLRVLLQRVR